MKKSMILIISIAAIALMTTNAFSWGHSRGQGGMRGGCAGYMSNTYQDLTPEQQDQLKALHQKWIDDTYEKRASMASIRNQMQMMMETTNPDRDKLVDLSAELADLAKDLAANRIDFQLAVQKIAPGFRMGPGFGMGHGWGCQFGGKGGRGFTDCPRFQDTNTPE